MTRPPGYLTRRQQGFVKELPLSRSATEAAIKAGYSPISAAESASQNLRLSNTAAAIAVLQAKTEGKTIATIVERKTKLSEILRKPIPDKVGVDSILAASDQLNRMESLYVTRTANLNLDVDVELEAFSLEELRALLEAARGKRSAAKGKG